MLSKYEEYILEKQIYNLVLESKLVLSSNFTEILSKINNKIAKDLLSINTKDIENITQNYINTTENKEKLSFIQDRRAQEIEKDKPILWKVIESNKTLTYSHVNDKIFESLGFDKTKQDKWSPNLNTIGLILTETTSTSTGKTYALFQEYGVDNPRLTVINKIGISISDSENSEVWTSNRRSDVRIGRIIRPILQAANITVTDKEIEDFVNAYKATFDFMKDALKQFDIVKGDKIAYWYNMERYVDGGGTLNNSCMAEVSEDYFDIYTQNKNVSLVILYSDKGTIEDNKYTSKYIKGRAILWDATIDRNNCKFLDRIYTVNDSDVSLFKKLAEKNGWYYKTKQTIGDEPITNGANSNYADIKVKLEKSDFDLYPYLDTMCYLSVNKDILSNKSSRSYPRCLQETDGGYLDEDDGYYDDDDE